MQETLTPEEERDLLQRAQEPDAFRRLYWHYFPRVYAYVAYRVGAEQDAEDIVADIFVQVVEAIDGFEYRGDGSFAAWVFRIAHNAVAQFYREQGRRVSVSLDALPTLHSPDAPPDKAMQTKERFQRLRQMIETLSPRRREVVSLRFFAGLRNQEIAAVLGLTERTVASHLCRGLEDLQMKYQQKELDA